MKCMRFGFGCVGIVCCFRGLLLVVGVGEGVVGGRRRGKKNKMVLLIVIGGCLCFYGGG